MPFDLFYFISSLPSLAFTAPAPMSHAQFLSRCEEALSARDFAKINTTILDITAAKSTTHSSKNAIQKQWQEFETYLRNVLAEQRAAKLHRKAPAPRETNLSDSYTKSTVLEAFNSLAGAEREQRLDRISWTYLDSLATQAPFSLDALAVYALKLQLLERIASRQLNTGIAAYNALVQKGVEQATENRKN